MSKYILFIGPLLFFFINQNHILFGQSNNALCKFDNLRFEYGSTMDFYAVENKNLQEKIKLNLSDSINQELHKLLSAYLMENNIMKFYGTLVFDEKDQIIFTDSYQNEMFNFYQSLDSLTISQKVLKERAHLAISDEALEAIKSIIKMGNWETGKCYGQKVNSYLQFHIENRKYKMPVGNNR